MFTIMIHTSVIVGLFVWIRKNRKNKGFWNWALLGLISYITIAYATHYLINTVVVLERNDWAFLIGLSFNFPAIFLGIVPSVLIKSKVFGENFYNDFIIIPFYTLFVVIGVAGLIVLMAIVHFTFIYPPS